VELLVGWVVFVIAGLVQGCTGFGMALVAAPCLMLTLPPTKAVPTIMLLSAANTALVAFEARRHIRLRLVGPLAAGSVTGMPLGIAALQVVDPTLLKVLVGGFVTFFSILLLSGWRKPIDNPRWTLLPVGLASGFLGGSTSMGGPPVILFLASQETPKDAFRGNISCFFLAGNCFGLALFVHKGLLNWSMGQQAAAFVPAMLLGTCIGVVLARRTPEKFFRTAIMVGVAFMGLVLLSTNMASLL